MPIDLTGVVINAPFTQYGTFTPNSKGVDQLRAILLGAGWVQAGDVKAKMTVQFPFFYPTTAIPPTTPDTHFVILLPLGWIYLYDPRTQTPSAFAFYNIPVAATELGTAQLIAATISGGVAGTFDGFTSGLSTMNFTSTLAGTAGNDYFANGNGGFTTGGQMRGGGWKLQSQPQTTFFGYGNTSVINMTIDNGTGTNIHLSTKIDSGVASDYFLASRIFRCLADSYQIRLYSDFPELLPIDPSFQHTDFWACCPVVELDDVSFARFTPPITLGFITNASKDTIGVTGVNFVQRVQGSESTHQSGMGGWGIVSYHLAGSDTLLDAVGQDVVQLPRLQMYDPTPSRPVLCGAIPSCFLFSKGSTTMFSQMSINSIIYRVIAQQQTGALTYGSLLMLTGEKGNDLENSVGSFDAAGTGRLSANTFVWESGDIFQSNFVGYTLSLGGPLVFTITNVVSSTGLVISPFYAGVIDNANFIIIGN